jgi:hypothetical protein
MIFSFQRGADLEIISPGPLGSLVKKRGKINKLFLSKEGVMS